MSAAEASAKPRAPVGLGNAGRALWKATVGQYELTAHEQRLLGQACATLDTIAELDAQVDADGVMSTGSMGQQVLHPAVAELRQQRLAFSRMLSQLALPDPEGGVVRTPERLRAIEGGRQRWRKQRRAEGA